VKSISSGEKLLKRKESVQQGGKTSSVTSKTRGLGVEPLKRASILGGEKRENADIMKETEGGRGGGRLFKNTANKSCSRIKTSDGAGTTEKTRCLGENSKPYEVEGIQPVKRGGLESGPVRLKETTLRFIRRGNRRKEEDTLRAERTVNLTRDNSG